MSLIPKEKKPKLSKEEKVLKETYKILEIKTSEDEKMLESLIKTDETMEYLIGTLKLLIEAKHDQSQKINRLLIHVLGSFSMLAISSLATLCKIKDWGSVSPVEQDILITTLSASLTASIIGPASTINNALDLASINKLIKLYSSLARARMDLEAIINLFTQNDTKNP